MRVSIKSILRNLRTNNLFLQPLYEAVANSLEANATRIVIDFYTDGSFLGSSFDKINGFSIKDNGDGFNKRNLNAFEEFWTDNKIELGCKGSGRFTWLKVFDDIDIESSVTTEKKHVSIHFTKDFDSTKDVYVQALKQSDEEGTRISFKNVTSDFFSDKKDARVYCNLEMIEKDILENLFVKLFMLKRNQIEFSISFRNKDEERVITNYSIPILSEKRFLLTSSITNETFDFSIYYLFLNDGNNNHNAFFCADARTINKNEADKLGINSTLPNAESFYILITSEYFNGKSNNLRDDFEELKDLEFPTIDNPLTLCEIRDRAKETIKEIFKEEIPSLQTHNSLEKEKAIIKAPYLAKYITQNDDVVQSKENLLKSANKAFSKEKEVIIRQFERLLENKNIDYSAFDVGVRQISQIAAEELGEYIVYRDTIIDALRKSLFDSEKKEDFLHTILIPKKTTTTDNENKKHLLSNLWILDDKFMTYSYVTSDVEIRKIHEELLKVDMSKESRKRPDVSVFFSENSNGDRDALMIELKGSFAEKDEKNKSIIELPNDIAALRSAIPNIITIWGYVVVKFDEDFRETVENQDYSPLFSSDSTYYAYYKYLKKLNAHIYVLDLETVINDASARNSTFINILKES